MDWAAAEAEGGEQAAVQVLELATVQEKERVHELARARELQVCRLPARLLAVRIQRLMARVPSGT
eukprot:6185272-Pleurochrysis_carterae.AAC.4